MRKDVTLHILSTICSRGTAFSLCSKLLVTDEIAVGIDCFLRKISVMVSKEGTRLKSFILICVPLLASSH